GQLRVPVLEGGIRVVPPPASPAAEGCGVRMSAVLTGVFGRWGCRRTGNCCRGRSFGGVRGSGESRCRRVPVAGTVGRCLRPPALRGGAVRTGGSGRIRCRRGGVRHPAPWPTDR